jgi:hypothetical protein
MKKLLILTILGLLLGGTAGCRFMECLWRGGPPQQPCQPAAVVPCQPACPTASACDPCGGAPATVVPGPTYAPGARP